MHSLRQQGKKISPQKNWALADLVAPDNISKKDYIGGFAVSAGFGSETLAKQFESENDDYNSILIKAIADRLAEAFAEHMHERVRKEFSPVLRYIPSNLVHLYQHPYVFRLHEL